MSRPLSPEDAAFARRRAHMVDDQISRRGVRDPAVLAAMGAVERHIFVPERLHGQAYLDRPIPIGLRQTISQPYIVALMSELANLSPGDRVLDVGTGSGYQAAILCELGADVYSLEILPDLAERARASLDSAGYERIHTRIADGWEGWAENAPYRAILLAAAPTRVPPALLDQLDLGGKLILPVGDYEQELIQITRTKSGFDRKRVTSVMFVPMTGAASDPDRPKIGRHGS